jgi:hypothetical protein
MRVKENDRNPAANAIPTHIVEDQLVQALVSSGYPLQGQVAHHLNREFNVIEEWGYIDDESGHHRTLDVYAQKDLDGLEDEVQPGLLLLIECKRSRNPYVFFQTAGIREITDFPTVSGIHHNKINISERQGGRSTKCSISQLLRLDALPFVAEPPPVCSAFSQAIPEGKGVSLSGADPFNHVILPLVKALRHGRTMFTLTTGQHLIFPIIQLAVCVLDAPMLLVEDPVRADEPVLTPWVRVARREATKDERGLLRNRFFAVDFVHIAFFLQLVRDHLMPFAVEFAQRSITLADALRRGASVPTLDGWDIEQVQPLPARR